MTKTLLGVAVFIPGLPPSLQWDSNPNAIGMEIKEGPRIHSGP